MPDFEFDRATTVQPLGEGRWAVELSDAYNIGPTPNGGYLTAVLARAALASLGEGELLNLSCYFLSAAAPGPAQIEVELVKRGRTTSVLQATLVQDGRARARTLLLAGDLDALDGPTAHESGPPRLPAREACVRVGAPFSAIAPLMRAIEVAIDPATAGFMQGRTGAAPEFRAWLRFADERPTDVLALALFADTLPPTTFNSLGVEAWVPTLELTTQIRQRPAPGPVRVEAWTRHLTRGHFEEDGEIWDANDELVAVFRQRAMLLAQRG